MGHRKVVGGALTLGNRSGLCERQSIPRGIFPVFFSAFCKFDHKRKIILKIARSLHTLMVQLRTHQGQQAKQQSHLNVSSPKICSRSPAPLYECTLFFRVRVYRNLTSLFGSPAATKNTGRSLICPSSLSSVLVESSTCCLKPFKRHACRILATDRPSS